MASLLETALPDSVAPAVFSPKIKSDLSWSFLGAAESGRYRDYLVCCRDADSEGYAMTGDADPRQFWHEVERCQYEVLLEPAPGPDRGS